MGGVLEMKKRRSLEEREKELNRRLEIIKAQREKRTADAKLAELRKKK
jgi:hypothetical protein